MFDISLCILDIVQNAITAQAKNITISYNISKNNLVITVSDDGCGMSPESLHKVLNNNTVMGENKVRGNGIAKLKMAAEDTGGSLKLSSELGIGTNVDVTFKLNSSNMPSIGKLEDTLLVLFLAGNSTNYVFEYLTSNNKNILDTKEIEDINSLNVSKIKQIIKDYMGSQLKSFN